MNTRTKLTAKLLWEAIKWSNLNSDGTITISVERVKLINERIYKECNKEIGIMAYIGEGLGGK